MRRDLPWQYEIHAAAGSQEAEIFLYDQIGEGLFSDGVGAKQFSEDLAALNVSHISLRINSPGGSVFEGQAIYNALVRHPAQVTSHIDGLAASIASVVALAGDRVQMAANALYMIHNPMGAVRGDAQDMRHTADVLDKVKGTITGIYMAKTGLDAEALDAAMTAETWYSADEAQAAGFVDEVGAAMQLAAELDPEALEAMGYRCVPDAIRNGASGNLSLPLADKGVAWDGAAARASIQSWAGGDDFDPAKMRQGFFWYDSAKPKNSTSYKLPFAKVADGKLTAVPGGIHAAAGAMSGARGGADIPSGDVAAVKAHIATYYSKMGETPPWKNDSERDDHEDHQGGLQGAGDAPVTIGPRLAELVSKRRHGAPKEAMR
jgi:ATP-dependent Clp protease, protease subunit